MSYKRIQINEADIEITHVRGSGPGGQNRNKRMSGVRIKHLPTGLVASATERRSQEQNRTVALERLVCKLEQLFTRPKVRVKTYASKTSQNKRLNQKRKNSEKKESRRASRGDFES